MTKSKTENALSADNQQERLIRSGWIVGFVEGEGCFSVGFIKQPNRSYKKGYKTGIQVWHEFAITQGASSLKALEEIKKFFGVGNIYLNKRYDNHREHLYRYVVRKREDLSKVIIPFFQSQEMHTRKKEHFEKFALTFKMVLNNDHLSKDGLIKIIKIAESMNSNKDRSELIRILRDYMPNTD